MTLNFSCENRDEINRLLSYLLGRELTQLKLQLNLDQIDKESLFHDLESLEINYKESETSLFEEDFPKLCEKLSEPEAFRIDLTVEHNWPHDIKAEIQSTTMNDKDLMFRVRELLGEAEIVKLCKQFNVGIHLDEELTIFGEESNFGQFLTHILTLQTKTISNLSFEDITCLLNNSFFNKLLKKNNVKCSIQKKGVNYDLVLYGNDKEAIVRCHDKVLLLTQNMKILFKLSRKTENIRVRNKILNYLERKYDLKHLRIADEVYGFECFYEKQNKQYIVFFYSDCEMDRFTSLANILVEGTKKVAFLDVTFGSKIESKYLLSLNPFMSNLFTEILPPRTLFVIGTIKDLLDEIGTLLLPIEANRDNFYLITSKFKAIEPEYCETLDDVINYNVQDNSYIFHTTAQTNFLFALDTLNSCFESSSKDQDVPKIEAVKTLLVKTDSQDKEFSFGDEMGLQKQRNNTRNQIVELNESKNSLRRNFEQDSVQKNKNSGTGQRDSLIGKNLYSIENLVDFHFEVDESESECEPVTEDSSDYKAVGKILRKGNSNIEIDGIIKINNQEQWASYIKTRKNYLTSKLHEYLLFFGSEDDPMNFQSQTVSIAEFKTRLNEKIDPLKQIFYDDGAFYNATAFLVLIDKENGSILDLYPAFFIIFK